MFTLKFSASILLKSTVIRLYFRSFFKSITVLRKKTSYGDDNRCSNILTAMNNDPLHYEVYRLDNAKLVPCPENQLYHYCRVSYSALSAACATRRVSTQRLFCMQTRETQRYNSIYFQNIYSGNFPLTLEENSLVLESSEGDKKLLIVEPEHFQCPHGVSIVETERFGFSSCKQPY